MKTLQGKVAVVTGAASGIGRELALALARGGARLALSDVNEAGLAETLALLPPGHAHTGNARAYVLDVASRDAVSSHAQEVLSDFGSVHYVFNNAGVSLGGSIEHSSIDEFEWLLGINLWGVIYVSKAFLPQLLAQGEGHIINISSVFGIIAFPYQGAYNVSKFGVRGFTECLWQELEGSGVDVTLVHPGGIKTAIAAKARIAACASEHEREVMGKSVKALLTPPEKMAQAIVQGVLRRRKRIIYGNGSRVMVLLQRWLPVSYGKVIKFLLRGL